MHTYYFVDNWLFPRLLTKTKTIFENGKEKFLHVKEIISNIQSPHTLLSTYLMRDLGYIVDDVSPRHIKSLKEMGTSSIQIPAGAIINLETRRVLSSFKLIEPTWEAWNNTKPKNIIEISKK